MKKMIWLTTAMISFTGLVSAMDPLAAPTTEDEAAKAFFSLFDFKQLKLQEVQAYATLHQDICEKFVTTYFKQIMEDSKRNFSPVANNNNLTYAEFENMYAALWLVETVMGNRKESSKKQEATNQQAIVITTNVDFIKRYVVAPALVSDDTDVIEGALSALDLFQRHAPATETDYISNSRSQLRIRLGNVKRAAPKADDPKVKTTGRKSSISLLSGIGGNSDQKSQGMLSALRSFFTQRRMLAIGGGLALVAAIGFGAYKQYGDKNKAQPKGQPRAAG